MKHIRFSNLAAMMAMAQALIAGTGNRSVPHGQRWNEEGLYRSIKKRHARFYGTNKNVIRETVDCRAAQRRRRHIAEGRYPQDQILRVNRSSI
jgi:hypothetical protein